MRAPTSRQLGFGIVEMLVALSLTSLLIVMVFGTFHRSQSAAARVSKVIEARQNSRTAMQLLIRDLRMMGSGIGRVVVQGSYNSDTLSVGALTSGYGGDPSASDTIGILGAWDATTTLAAAMPAYTTNIRTVSAAGFAVNDLVVVTDGVTAHLFQVTSINTNDLVHSSASTYNRAGGHIGWPAGGYKIGANVYRMTWVSYKVDSSSSRRPALMRWQNNELPQVVAYDIGEFRVNYVLSGDSLVRNPDDLGLVTKVQPVLYTRATAPAAPTIVDSSWAMIKPRSY